MNAILDQLDFHTLTVLEAVAKTGSFTRADRELGLTQSAVSRKIQGLADPSLGRVLYNLQSTRHQTSWIARDGSPYLVFHRCSSAPHRR